MKKFLVCTTALAMLPSAAWAQDNNDNENDSTIYVTAERRAENVQDVPISVVALSGETLRERGVETLGDLTSEVPSFSFVDNGNTKYINIRGVGVNESAPSSSVGVAVHVDGTYIAREFTFGDAFFDVESVQVLRGPQGTYSGQNANGGAIFIESARPVLGRVEGYAQATIGEFSRRDVEAAVSAPIGDNLAVRISGRIENRDSFYTNYGPANVPPSQQAGGLIQPADREAIVGRVQLLWEPDASFQTRLIHQFSNTKNGGTAYQIGRPEDYADPFILNYNNTPYDGNQTKYHRTTGIVRWDFSESVRLNANLTYQDTINHETAGDLDRTAVEQNQGTTALSDDYWTGELTLLSMADSPFEWTIGATFLDYSQIGNVYNEPSPGVDDEGDPLPLPVGNGRNIYIESFRKNFAFFGEVGYAFTPELTVKLGGRYNHDESGYDEFTFYRGRDFTMPLFSLPGQGQSASFEEFTGRVLVNWEPNPDHLIYGTISRGYKPGGITAVNQRFEAALVTNYEAGWKGTLANGAVNGSVSIFHMTYDGYQASVQPDPNDPTSALTENVDGTTVTGIEAQLSANVGGLSADVAFSYLDTSFGEQLTTLPAGADGNATDLPFQFKGRKIPWAPEFSISGGLAYEMPVGGGYLTPSVRVSHVAEQYSAFFRLPYHVVDERTLVDLRLSYAPNDDFRITAYVTNLFDELYVSNASDTTNGVGQFLLGAPQEFGVTAAVNF